MHIGALAHHLTMRLTLRRNVDDHIAEQFGLTAKPPGGR